MKLTYCNVGGGLGYQHARRELEEVMNSIFLYEQLSFCK